MILLEKFIQNASARPDDIYLKDDNAELTYREAIEKITTCRLLLREKGISESSKVVILSSNENSFVISLLSILFEGGIAVPVSLESAISEIDTIVKESRSQVIIGPLSFLSKNLIITTNKRNEPFISRESFMADRPANSPISPLTNNLPETDIKNTRLILFTSGSEGTPKGVCLTEEAITFAIDLCANDFWNIKETDRILLIAPVQTTFGITMTLVSALTGSGIRLMSNFNPQMFIQALIEDKITFFAGVPTLAELMLKLEDRIPKSALQLKKVLIAGAPLPEITEKKVETNFGIKIITGYGMTEGVPMAYRNEFDLNYPNRSVGKIAVGCSLKVVGDDNTEVENNVDGEIVVKGKQIFAGYIKNGAIDKSCFEDGWFRTGDIGRLDPDGYLFITGRKSDMIKRSGHRVFPAEIENALTKLNGISASAVIGISDVTRGEKIIAFISGEDSKPKNEILNELKTTLSAHKIPNEIIKLESFPLNIAGKTDKLMLRDNYLKGIYQN